MKNFLLVLSIALTIVLLGCKPRKPDSIGRARDVVVFTEHKDLLKYELDFALESPIHTPQPENEFNVRYMNFEDLDFRRLQHSLFFAGFDNDWLLKEYFPELSAKDSFALYKLENYWADNQIILIFIARDTTSFIMGLKQMRSKIRNTYKFQVLNDLNRLTYVRNTDKELSKEVAKYGFELKVPRSWLLDTTYAALNFISIHAHTPDRSIFVYWEDQPRENLNAGEAIALRDSVCRLFYDGDYLDTIYTTAGVDYFRGKKAVRIQGIWQNDSMVAGGPCITYAYNEGGRFYMVDAMLFYPDGSPRKKVFWLNQLEVVMATFSPR